MYADHQQGWFHGWRQRAHVVVLPLQWLSYLPERLGTRIYHSVANNQQLLIENAKFRAQNLLLQAKVQQLLQLSQENKDLRRLLKSSAQFKKDRELVGRILMEDPQVSRAQIIVDQGSGQKVYVGQPVLDAYGVLGQVIDVTPYTSRILLLNDQQSAIPVEDRRTHQRAIALGRSNQTLLELIHVTDSKSIAPGDLWVASGLGLRFPAGYPVGRVDKVIKQPGATGEQIWLAPMARLDRAQQVLFIWPYAPKIALTAARQLARPVVPSG